MLTLNPAADLPAAEVEQQDVDGLDRERTGYAPGDDQATIWRNNRAYWKIKHKQLVGISHVLFAHGGEIVGAAYLFGSQDSRAESTKGKSVLSGSPASSHELIGKPVPVPPPTRSKTQPNPVHYRKWSDEENDWVS